MNSQDPPASQPQLRPNPSLKLTRYGRVNSNVRPHKQALLATATA
jgi:hypothetical protein